MNATWLLLACWAQSQTLPNGVELPSEWPPRTNVTKDAASPPYLAKPPAVIPVDVGRQLFVDDFLVESTTLERTFHRARYHEASPVLRPDRAWEDAVAMPFSDGVWYDPADRLYKMWYMAGKARHTCLATSADGLSWTKPELDVKAGTNIVNSGPRDSSTVWLDLDEKDPKRRYTMFRCGSGGSTVPKAYGLRMFFSEDGIHWGEPVLLSGSCGDRSTVFKNPFRDVWVYSLRHGWGQPRARRYWERADLLKSPMWSAIGEPAMWVGADDLDPQRPDYKVPCQLYNLDAVAYESLIVGLFTIWRGQFPDRQKPNEICLGFSRDGYHWTRPDRRPFCPVSDQQGTWNANNVQSAGGGFLVVGDELRFYVSGRAGVAGSNAEGTCSTGLAVLRRDGFASLDGEGAVTTRPVRFAGKHLFVNLDGELHAEVLDEEGKVLGRSEGVAGDKTLLPVPIDLAPFAGKPVRFRFHLKKGRLYAFWVSSDPAGASRGYVAAGGPGFAGSRDLPR